MTGPIEPEGYEVRRLKGFVRGHLIEFAVLGVPFLSVLAVLIFGSPKGSPQTVLFVMGGLIAIVGLVRQQRRMSRHRCGGCGARLRRQRTSAGTPITFTCEACRVVWDTRFIEGGDGGG